jgi:hypothetical protein
VPAGETKLRGAGSAAHRAAQVSGIVNTVRGHRQTKEQVEKALLWCAVCFKGCSGALQSLFDNTAIAPSEMRGVSRST